MQGKEQGYGRAKYHLGQLSVMCLVDIQVDMCIGTYMHMM